MGGLHNIENCIAAITIAKHLGIEDDKMIAAISDFKGVKRRFEYILKNENHILIDDYAHHPEELRALITGVKSLFGEEKMPVSQHHFRLYTLTNGSLYYAASATLTAGITNHSIYWDGATRVTNISSAVWELQPVERHKMFQWSCCVFSVR